MEKPHIQWQILMHSDFPKYQMLRAKVPGGWFVTAYQGDYTGQTLMFYPDPEHTWNGGSFPLPPANF